MNFFLDILATLAVLAIAGGVYLEFGIGWALIALGALVLALAMNGARLINAADDS